MRGLTVKTRRRKTIPPYIGAEMGLMNYFFEVFICSGFVSIGRNWGKNFCDFFDFFVSQKRLYDIKGLESRTNLLTGLTGYTG